MEESKIVACNQFFFSFSANRQSTFGINFLFETLVFDRKNEIGLSLDKSTTFRKFFAALVLIYL